MSARGNTTDVTKTRRRTMGFMGNLIAILSLVVIGYPLASATIRTMLVGWILVVAAIMRIILGHRFQLLGSAMTRGQCAYLNVNAAPTILLND